MTRPLSSNASRGSALGSRSARPGLADLRPPLVVPPDEAGRARVVNFDRALVELPGLGDPKVARQIAEALRSARERGTAEGYAAGWAQGRRAAAEAAEAEAAERAEREEATRRQLVGRAQELFAALAATSRTRGEQAAPAWDEVVEVLLDGCLRVVTSALGRELAAVDGAAVEAMRAALRILPSAESTVVHVHPADAALVGASADLPDGVAVVVDDTVPEGGVVARTPLQSLPVDLQAALRAVEEVLRA